MARKRVYRTFTSKQRDAMIKRKMAAAAKIKGKPWVALVFVATGDRSEVKNIIIARAQAKQGRNPWRLLAADVKRIHGMIEDDMVRLMRGESSLIGPILSKIGTEMVANSKANIDAQRRLKPVNLEYAAGNPGKILKRTGQLYSAVRFKVKAG